MENNFKDLVDFYHQKRIEGMDFSKIRKELADKEVEVDMIKDIVRTIDNRMLRGEVRKPKKSKAKELRLIGWLLMIVGGVLTLGIFFHWFDAKGYHFISYGPVIIGYLFIIAARRSQKKSA